MATLDHRRIELESLDERSLQREATLEQRASNLAQRETNLIERERDAVETRRLEQLRGSQGVTGETGRGRCQGCQGRLLQRVEDEARREAMVLMRDLEMRAREEADKRARRILTTTVKRLASEVVAETTLSTVALPSDDMKGRIIGRDGRNIRAFEAVTGVNIIVDDTLEAVGISSFDPIRREVARLALERLIADGRIHPASIEDAYEKALGEVEQSVRDGEWAILEVGISRMHPELVNLLGRLKYRLSYGQNVLHHLIESGKVAGMLAAGPGVDQVEARRAAFLHDIGKAVSHEPGGSHALVGLRSPAGLVRRRRSSTGSRRTTTKSSQHAHRGDRAGGRRSLSVPTGSSPRGRRGVTCGGWNKLEAIAKSFPGVERVHAMQAGREVRVVVDPGLWTTSPPTTWCVGSPGVSKRNLQYPGQIEVTVIRELRYRLRPMTLLGLPVVRERRTPTRVGKRYLVRPTAAR